MKQLKNLLSRQNILLALLAGLLTHLLIFRRMTKPIRNNNPFALIDETPSRWIGLVKGSTGFLSFNSMVYGIRAGFINLVNAYLKRKLNTIEKIIPVYAPAGHGSNNPEKYITLLSKLSGIERDEIINSQEKLFKLGKAITRVESGSDINEKDLQEGFAAAMAAIVWPSKSNK